MRKIESITIVSNQGVSTISIGQSINGLEITEIKDKSLEYENSIDFIYTAYDKGGEVIKEIINCPVEVTFHEVERKDGIDSLF